MNSTPSLISSAPSPLASRAVVYPFIVAAAVLVTLLQYAGQGCASHQLAGGSSAHAATSAE